MDNSPVNFWDVDPNSLDRELFDQPTNYYALAKNVADARLVVEQAKIAAEIAKEELKRTDAELYVSILNHPDRFGLSKATEKSIESAVLCDKEHRLSFDRLVNAKRDLADKEHACGVAEAALGAMDNKKVALQKGVELHLANYRSSPRPRDNGSMPVGERRQSPV